MEDVYKEDDQTVIFKMKADNPNKLMVEDGLGAAYIIPEHIWAKVEEDAGNDIAEIRKFDNKDPIGSGPYRVYYESPETIILERVDDYWEWFSTVANCPDQNMSFTLFLRVMTKETWL